MILDKVAILSHYVDIVAAEVVLHDHRAVPASFRNLETNHGRHVVLVSKTLVVGDIVFLHPKPVVVFAMHHLVDVVGDESGIYIWG